MKKKKKKKINTRTIERSNNIMLVPYRRWPMCCLLFFLLACANKKSTSKLFVSTQDSIKEAARIDRAYLEIDSIKNIIYTGDMITRTGNDFTSESLRKLNQHDKTYSHCGIASIENDTVFVYHAIGGEFNPDQKIRRDALLLFAEPYDNRGIGIFRYGIDKRETDTLISFVKKMFAAGVMFDMKFDLDTDDRMYCAEFVFKSYTAASKKLKFDSSHINDFIFIGVDDLFRQPKCSSIKKLLYK